MKSGIRFIALLLVFIPGALIAAGQGGPVDERKDVSPNGNVAVSVVRGDVRFVGWDEPAVRVVGTLDEATEEFIFEVDDDETFIKVKINQDESSWFGSIEPSDLTIYLPSESRLEMSGVSTDIDIKGLERSIDVSSVSGDINLAGGPGRVEIQSVSGDIALEDVTGRLEVGSVSGDIEARGATGEAEYSSVSGSILVEAGGSEISAETVSGDIRVVAELVASIGGHSVSGDISVSGDPVDDATIKFDSVSGTIHLELGGEVNARFDLETGSGTIRNDLSNHQPNISRYRGDETLTFTLGDGEGQVLASTRSGDITVAPR